MVAKYETKADSSFKSKLGAALDCRDWSAVEVVFFQYGTYLELIEPPAPKSLEFVGHNEPSAIEEHEYLFSGEHAKFCIHTLHVDPVTLIPLSPEQLAEHGVIK